VTLVAAVSPRTTDDGGIAGAAVRVLLLLALLLVGGGVAVFALRAFRNRGEALGQEVSVQHRVGPPVLHSTHHEFWEGADPER
jgi:hypothetical protein